MICGLYAIASPGAAVICISAVIYEYTQCLEQYCSNPAFASLTGAPRLAYLRM